MTPHSTRLYVAPTVAAQGTRKGRKTRRRRRRI